MPKSENTIPANLQPKPAEYSFDLDEALRSIVALRATVPDDAFTAGTLGTERMGSAVHIRPGLFLTIGYLITEAESVWLTAANGQAVAGHAMAYDQDTGFGLVQALGRLDVPVMELGDSDKARVGEPVIFAAAGGRRQCVAAKVAGRQEFAGYWEYLLDDAIFTAPSHPFWGGAALVGRDGRLLGIGSLVLQQGPDNAKRQDMNMVVPVQLLRPILDDLLSFGRVNRPPRPWLGLYAMEDDEALVVASLADNGPADQAGVRTGDRILSVNGADVPDLAGLWRAVWASGPR
ncbi:MAG: serine protease, partial [Gemmatimonadaceae bacterium]|nr:serine protease [Acetobacteraceae bacterium]